MDSNIKLSKEHQECYQFIKLFKLISLEEINTEEQYNHLSIVYNKCLNIMSKIILKSKINEIQNNIDNLIKESSYLELLVKSPSINGTIPINYAQLSPRFEVKNMIITNASNLDKLRKLPKTFEGTWFNEWFINKNIIEAYIILKQMNVLRNNCFLEKTINIYEQQIKAHQKFIKDLIDIIIEKTNDDDMELKHAKAIANIYNIDYDFTNILTPSLKKTI